METASTGKWHVVSEVFFGSPWKILLWGLLCIGLYLSADRFFHIDHASRAALMTEALRDIGIAFIVVFGVSMAVEIRAADRRDEFL